MNFMPSEPTLTISPKAFTFNAACMNLLPNADYVLFLQCFKMGQLIVKECSEITEHSTPWRINCSSRDVRPRPLKLRSFYKLICEEMGWKRGYTYSIPASSALFVNEPAIMFELNNRRSPDEEMAEREFQRMLGLGEQLTV